MGKAIIKLIAVVAVVIAAVLVWYWYSHQQHPGAGTAATAVDNGGPITSAEQAQAFGKQIGGQIGKDIGAKVGTRVAAQMGLGGGSNTEVAAAAETSPPNTEVTPTADSGTAAPGGAEAGGMAASTDTGNAMPATPPPAATDTGSASDQSAGTAMDTTAAPPSPAADAAAATATPEAQAQAPSGSDMNGSTAPEPTTAPATPAEPATTAEAAPSAAPATTAAAEPASAASEPVAMAPKAKPVKKGPVRKPQLPHCPERPLAWWRQTQSTPVRISYIGTSTGANGVGMVFVSSAPLTADSGNGIRITTLKGKSVSPQWSLGSSGTMLFANGLKLGCYHVSLAADLADANGNKLGQAIDGNVQLR